MLQVGKLYPQYRVMQDRRQLNAPVQFERRSGIDRRELQRIKLDTNLTRDVFEIRNTINTVNQKAVENIPFAQKILSIMNTAETRKLLTGVDKTGQEIQSSNGSKAGILTAALASTFGLLLLGAAGVVVGLGAGFYVGCKSIKNVILSHIKKL